MVRTRIAPSPTGFPHIGTIYQVLFDYAFARKHNGKFVLRLEDTDRKRLVEGAEDIIYTALDWFNLSPDESPKKGGQYGPYRQSERLTIYKKYSDELVEKGHAYYCFCTRERLEEMRNKQIAAKLNPKYDRLCLGLSKQEVQSNIEKGVNHVIRMKIPADRTIVLNDMVIGKVEFDSNLIDDQVIMKSDGFPTYHLGVVVDDHLMKISHIIRGREWVSSTPKHILLYEFFGWEMPEHAHLPLILNNDGKGKLSKRHGHASVEYYRSLGYLPEAVLNYLSNLVWYHPENREIYDLEEFIKLFDITKINSQGARFNLEKLDWINGEYIRKMDTETLTKRIISFIGDGYDPVVVRQSTPLVQERMKKLGDYIPLTEFMFRAPEKYEIDLSQKKDLILAVSQTLQALGEWKADAIGDALVNLAKNLGIKNSEFFMILRVAITGKKISPPLNESIQILGKEKVLELLSGCIEHYRGS